MRIVYVTETYPPEVNGVALTVARTVGQLRRRGHAVTLVRPRQPGEAARDDAGEWRTAGLPIPMYRDLRFGVALTSTLRRRFARQRPELVHVATPGPLGAAAVRAARALALPVTTDYRTNFDAYSRYYGFGWLAPMVHGYLQRFHDLGHRTFVPTRAMQAQLHDAGFSRLHVIGRGVDTTLFSPERRSEAWRSGHAPVLLHVGRLAAEKNVALALRAFDAVRERQPDARMLVVGDGPQRARLKARFPAATFVGALRGEALASVYASADVFLFPSLSETFGNVTLEAMASGLAVVAYDAAAAGEYLRGNAGARLVAPGDEDGFIAAACELAALPPERLRQCGALAREAALKLRWEDVCAQFERQLIETAEALHGAQASPSTAALVA